MTQRKTLIVFDIDGTLTDSVKQHQAAFVAALTEMGVQEINTDFKAYKHHTDSHIAKVIYELDRKEIFDSKQSEVFETLLWKKLSKETIPVIEGARELIKLLEQEEGIGICFATGSMHKPAVYKLEQAGIKFAAGQLVASNGIEERESIVLAAIAQAKKHYGQDQFERIISIGDGLWDLLTAQKLGLEFIGIGTAHKPGLLAHGMTLHVNDWNGFNVQHLISHGKDLKFEMTFGDWHQGKT